MSDRIPVPCENCGRELLIRTKNLGRIGKCNYCGCHFRAQLHSRFELSVSRPSPPSDEEARAAPGSAWLGPSPTTDSVPSLAPHETPLAAEQEPDEARPAIDTFVGELATLRERAKQLARLRERIGAEVVAIEQARAQHEEAQSLASVPDAPSPRENAEQFDALRAECNRFREETEILRARMEEQEAEATSRSEQLARQCAAACAERDRLSTECEESAREADRARDLSNAEREALIQQVDNLQNRLEALERAQDKSEDEHRATRAAWDEERQQLEACSDRQRQELDDLRRRCTEHEARAADEQLVWRQQSDEQQRRLDEVTDRLQATEELRGRTARDRDARAEEVERLQVRLEAAESQRDQARADWEIERRELEAAAQRQCQQQRGDAEHKLAKQERGSRPSARPGISNARIMSSSQPCGSRWRRKSSRSRPA